MRHIYMQILVYYWSTHKYLWYAKRHGEKGWLSDGREIARGKRQRLVRFHQLSEPALLHLIRWMKGRFQGRVW
jgi:hypothetical protein